MELMLVRHARPAIAPGWCYGQLDVDLAAGALASLPALATELRAWRPDLVISSPLQRCRRLAGQLDVSVHYEPALMEMSFGAWEGRRWDSMAPSEYGPWAADWINQAPPGGESLAQLADRVQTCVSALCHNENSARRLLLVVHAGVIRVLLCRLLDLPLASSLRFEIVCGGCCLLRHRQGWQLVCE